MKILILTYIAIIFCGALALMLPFMHNGDLSFLEAFFTAASAFTCTGLIVKDTGQDFTIYGQGVIITLIQLGGFGYMSMLGLLYVLMRRRLSHRERNMLKESLNYPTYDGMIFFIRKVLLFVLILEGIGTLLLWGYFIFYNDVEVLRAFWLGFFHAISAFNNAGFSVFSTNLMTYRDNLFINLVICSLVIIGGLGYIVMIEVQFFVNSILSRWIKRQVHPLVLSLHSKIVLIVTFCLILAGCGFTLLLEWDNTKSIGEYSFYSKFLSSFFMSVNYRTSGFNTIDLSTLRDSTMFFSSLLMVVGGAPGGAAGGIKVTTFAVLIAFCFALFFDTDVRLFRRRVAESSVKKAVVMLIIASSCIIFANLVVSLFEKDTRFALIMFEVCSAFSTVGVSTGNGGVLSLVANFSTIPQLMIIFLMIMGKVGTLAFWLAFVGKRKQSHIKLPEEKVII